MNVRKRKLIVRNIGPIAQVQRGDGHAHEVADVDLPGEQPALQPDVARVVSKLQQYARHEVVTVPRQQEVVAQPHSVELGRAKCWLPLVCCRLMVVAAKNDPEYCNELGISGLRE